LQEKNNQQGNRLHYWFLALSSKALKLKLHGRSSDLLPFMNAFPNISGKSVVQNV